MIGPQCQILGRRTIQGGRRDQGRDLHSRQLPFRRRPAHDEDNGKTLVIFNTADDVFPPGTAASLGPPLLLLF
jgi:hypothetical protein